MARGRKPIVLDKVEFQSVIDNVEAKGSFSTHSQVWAAICETEWARGLTPRPLTPQVAMLKAKALGILLKTPKGKKGDFGESRGKGIRTKRRLPLELISELKAEYGPTCDGKINRMANGSLKSAITLKCIDCSNFQKSEIANCKIRLCPLWGFRPYQHNTEEETKIEIPSTAA